MDHHAQALVLTCIDFRFQEAINNWIDQNFPPKTYDRVALAGGVKNPDIIMEQIDIAVRLHHIKKAVLINHEDCGAYGKEGDSEKHTKDLKNAEDQIKKSFPNLIVESYFLHLDGTFEKIS